MSCLSCFSSQEKKVTKRPNNGNRTEYSAAPPKEAPFQSQQWQDNNYHNARASPKREPRTNKEANKDTGNNNIAAQTFTFRELASITRNFRQECLIGEGGFGRVYKGKIEKTNQEVAVKQLDRNGLQGNREFLVEVLMLSLLHHQNLVSLIGYCADGDQRLLVYEYMPLGSVEDHLLDLHPQQKPLDWFTRMKIALDAAKGLEYLHDKANPPVIYRDLKSSNILLDNDYNAKLSDFGLAKLGPTGEDSHVSSRVMGTYGYCAPEYQRTGQITVKSDVYSFGVVLLELITGRRAIDNTRPSLEQNLISWAYPVFKDRHRYPELADPLLEQNFPMRSLDQAVAVAAMCLNEEPSVRPLISDVVTALSFLGTQDPALLPSIDIPSSPRQEQEANDASTLNLLDNDSVMERQRAVAEAIEWGSNSRNKAANLRQNGSSLQIHYNCIHND
ncbi:putative protein kinase RLK-Pelle-RLCK-VIIa-1 family [Lupinus albus]|uniref:non-specific serine/threonine protein kinase n=1 Tax=Lupinus albus TaxID=3870 RepID=A0A6A4QV96_LUPAL|nr:putative protein kinase RLK-Pelle-RLCK-VIIa-1 family [Lupinus albus]